LCLRGALRATTWTVFQSTSLVLQLMKLLTEMIRW
jgi:hypothetical protein